MSHGRLSRPVAACAAAALFLAGCSSATSSNAAGSPTASAGTTVTVTNCKQPVSYPSAATRFFVNDASLITTMVAIGAQKDIVGMSSLNRDHTVLTEHYGASALNGLKQVSSSMPGLETVVGTNPQVVLAGWNYGFKQGGVNPDALKNLGIDSYVLSSSCLQKQGEKARGIMDPWTALYTDIANLGTITGHTEQAATVLANVKSRVKALEDAPQATDKPKVLMFDSGTSDVFTSGRMGEPQGIITAAGATNVMSDIDDTWTTVSWEKIAATKPDVIVFDDYGSQTFAQKVAVLESNPATKNLPAVKEKRFLNLPYAMWVSDPLDVDSAEQLRYQLEQWNLVPKSTLGKPKYDDNITVSPAS